MAQRILVECTDCPWSGTYRTQGIAEHALRRHSCARHLEKAEASERHRAAMDAIDRTPKPCHHPLANHRHGTYTCYTLDRCKCPPCAKANSEYESKRERLKAYGRWQPYVSSARARVHILHLMSQGMGRRNIAAHAGLSDSVLWALIHGKKRTPDDVSGNYSKKIRPETEQRILDVKLELADGQNVDSTGTRRRLQALATIGWSVNAISKRFGMSRGALDQAINSSRPHVRKSTADRVSEIYDEIWNSPPVSTSPSQRAGIARAIQRAKDSGWSGPLGWDDDSIDDPSATPQGLGRTPRKGTGRPVEDVIEDVEHLLRSGAPLGDIPRRVGYKSYDNLERVLYRAGRGDLAAKVRVSDTSDSDEAGVA